MARNRRPGFSEFEKAEIWRGWKSPGSGDLPAFSAYTVRTLSDIAGRAFFLLSATSPARSSDASRLTGEAEFTQVLDSNGDPGRFERATPSFGGWCSIQLSYRATHFNPSRYKTLPIRGRRLCPRWFLTDPGRCRMRMRNRKSPRNRRVL